jgi:hypothetical protein
MEWKAVMKILVACICYPVASGRYLYDAFKRLGHDVRVIGDSTGNQIWGMSVDPKYTWASDGGLTAHWDDWRPDVIVIAESAWAYHSPYYHDVPHVIYAADNHVRIYRQYGVYRYFVCHNAPSLMDMSAPDVEWMPGAYDPVWFTPSPIPWAERPYDVCMIGVLYPQRVELLNALAAAGLKVFAGTGLLFDQYRDAYHNSRISLCASANHDLAFRIFETAAMGCAVLSDPLPDLEALDAKNVWTYGDVDSAVEIAKGILKHAPKDTYDAVGQSLAWAAPHTWDARAQRIVDWWQETYAPKPKGRKGEKQDATPAAVDTDRVTGAPEGDGDGASGDGGA